MSNKDVVLPHRIAIGIIRKTIGLKGMCAVEALGTSLERLTPPIPGFLGVSEFTVIPSTLEHKEKRSKGFVCSFNGISSVESAEALYGYYIFIDATLLPDLNDGTYYHFELIGLKVQTDQGKEIGTVIAVHNFPTVDSVEVRGMGTDSFMVPLTADAIVDLDRKSGFLTIRQSYIEDL